VREIIPTDKTSSESAFPLRRSKGEIRGISLEPTKVTTGIIKTREQEKIPAPKRTKSFALALRAVVTLRSLQAALKASFMSSDVNHAGDCQIIELLQERQR
jgi:hypothetical protein